MGYYTRNYDMKRHMNRFLNRENKIVYYNEYTVDNCWDPYQGKYQTTIYTYISKYKFLWMAFYKVHQSIPYIDTPSLDGEIKTNIMLKEAARKEYYKAVLLLNEKNIFIKAPESYGYNHNI